MFRVKVQGLGFRGLGLGAVLRVWGFGVAEEAWGRYTERLGLRIGSPKLTSNSPVIIPIPAPHSAT